MTKASLAAGVLLGLLPIAAGACPDFNKSGATYEASGRDLYDGVPGIDDLGVRDRIHLDIVFAVPCEGAHWGSLVRGK